MLIWRGEDIEIAFNARYISDVIKNVDEECCTLCMNTNVSPCVISPGGRQLSLSGAAGSCVQLTGSIKYIHHMVFVPEAMRPPGIFALSGDEAILRIATGHDAYNNPRNPLTSPGSAIQFFHQDRRGGWLNGRVLARAIGSTEAFDTQKQIFENAPMSRYTTLRLGGPGDVLVQIASVEQLSSAYAAARMPVREVRVLGNGSNLLIRDGGVRGFGSPAGRAL